MIALAVCYPLAAHLAVLTGSPRLTLVCLGLLVALALAPALSRRRPAAWLAALVAAGALALPFLAPPRWTWLPLYAPTVLGDVFLAWLFGHTLARGQVPLVERMVRLLHAPAVGESLDPQIVRYVRRLTAAWSLLFAALGLTDLLLALLAVPNGVLPLLGVVPVVTVPQRVWSWFANIAEYAIGAAFFVAEYTYRRWRFPQQPYAGLLDFVRRLSAIAPRVLAPAAQRAAGGVTEQT